MENKFKYLTHNHEDEQWGLFLTVAGISDVSAGSEYPPVGHPTGYNFLWENGRELHEYQLNYITEGEGIIETKDGTFPVKAGSVIIVRPEQWHRYKPLKNKGWREHYVGFNGILAERIGRVTEAPVLHIGFHDELIQAFQDIFFHIKAERPGYHQVCAGWVMYIIGKMVSFKKAGIVSGSNVEDAIQKASIFIRENLDKNLDVEKLAADLDIGYSLFRKSFKKYTGLSPVQYHLSLRIQQAVYLLTNTNLSVKEISFNLGFCSVYYFSKLFKDKTGKNPSDFSRKK